MRRKRWNILFFKINNLIGATRMAYLLSETAMQLTTSVGFAKALRNSKRQTYLQYAERNFRAHKLYSTVSEAYAALLVKQAAHGSAYISFLSHRDMLRCDRPCPSLLDLQRL